MDIRHAASAEVRKEGYMQRINQNMTGYRIPAYVEEILTENYCKNFVRMSIIRDSGSYSFSYRPAGLSRLDTSSMGLYEKLLLIRNLISMSCSNPSWSTQRAAKLI